MTQEVNRSDIVPTQKALQELEHGIIVSKGRHDEIKRAILAFDSLAIDKDGNPVPERIKAYWEHYHAEYGMCVGRSYCLICERWSGGYEDSVSGDGNPAVCMFCWEKDAVQEVIKRVDPNEDVFLHTKEIIPEHIRGMNPVTVKQKFRVDYLRLTRLQKLEFDLMFRVRMVEERKTHYDCKSEPTEYDNLMDHYTYYSDLGQPTPEFHVDCVMCNSFVRNAKIYDILTEPRICESCYKTAEIQEVFKRVDPKGIVSRIKK
jgi:hypothetical protein